ncbi:MAG: response regulator [Myxococcales bacterium]|nr:MAG: response regulator [Myxococcales bacterium]
MTLTILAVDDSATMRSILEMTFAGEDANVVSVQSADAARGQVDSLQPDVAIVDNSLPSTSSYDLCRTLKQSQPSLRVLVLASEQHPYDEGKGRSAGVDGHATKPFETQVLIEKVQNMLGRASNRPSAPQGGISPAQNIPQGTVPMAPPISAGGQPGAPRFRQKTVMGTGAALPPLPGMGAPLAGSAPQAPSPNRMSIGTAATQERPASTPPARAATPSPVAAPPVVAAAPLSAASISLEQKLSGLGLDKTQMEAVLTLSREVIEQVVWEVVPDLAETLIREEIRRLTED